MIPGEFVPQGSTVLDISEYAMNFKFKVRYEFDLILSKF